MLIFEAREELQSRVDLMNADCWFDGKDQIKEAYEMAVKALEAQQRVCDLLNDFWDDTKPGDSYSAQLVYDIINSLHMDFVSEEE